MAGDDFRPKSLLPAIQVQFCAAWFFRFFFGYEWLLAIKSIGPAIPLPGNIAVPPKRNQSTRARAHTKSGHLRQIAACGLAHDKDLVAINSKQSGALFAHPVIGIADIFNDGG